MLCKDCLMENYLNTIDELMEILGRTKCIHCNDYYINIKRHLKTRKHLKNFGDEFN
jgi:hypothetical protein